MTVPPKKVLMPPVLSRKPLRRTFSAGIDGSGVWSISTIEILLERIGLGELGGEPGGDGGGLTEPGGPPDSEYEAKNDSSECVSGKENDPSECVSGKETESEGETEDTPPVET